MKKLILLLIPVFMTACTRRERPAESNTLQVISDSIVITQSEKEAEQSIFDFEYTFCCDAGEDYAGVMTGEIYADCNGEKYSITGGRIIRVSPANPEYRLDFYPFTALEDSIYGGRLYVSVGGVFEKAETVTHNIVSPHLPGRFLKMVNLTFTTTMYDRRNMLNKSFYITSEDINSAAFPKQ